MSLSFRKKFMLFKLMGRPMFSDDALSLCPRFFVSCDPRMDFGSSAVFEIIEKSSGKTAGEIALRFGEGPSFYYIGHIGYHIDPTYRGAHYALRACKAILSVYRELGISSIVITTDPDNLPSRKTCMGLGCLLESVVDVPERIQKEFELSSQKLRYVLTLEKELVQLEIQ